jgi:hypothetical protein
MTNPVSRASCANFASGPGFLSALLGALSLLSGLSSPALAQGAEPRPSPQPPRVAPPVSERWLLVDETVGMLGGEAMTFSVVRPGYERAVSRIMERRPPEQKELDPQLRRSALLGVLYERMRAKVLADHARTLGDDPSQLEKRINVYVAQQIQREKDEAGSNAAFFARLEEQGVDYREYEDGIREQVLRSVVLQDVFTELDRQAHLQVTPREMLRYYRENRAAFAEKPRGTAILLRMRPQEKPAQGDAPASLETQESLVQRAEALRARVDQLLEQLRSELPAEDGPERSEGLSKLRDRILALAESEGCAFEQLDVREGGSTRQEIRDFVLRGEGPEIALSPLLPSASDRYLVLRIGREEGGTIPFASREVQEGIRTMLLETRRQELRSELFLRLLANAQVWPKDIEAFARLRR